MSVSAQIIFPYMPDARTPAMNVPLTAQDACKVRSFQVFLSAMLIVNVCYGLGKICELREKMEFSETSEIPGNRKISLESRRISDNIFQFHREIREFS